MKKTVWTAAIIGTMMAGGMGGCQDKMPVQDTESYVEKAVNDIKIQAAEEFKKAFANEVSEFFRSDDLVKSLGIDSDGQEKLETSIKEYISNYSMDEEKLGEAKESLDSFSRMRRDFPQMNCRAR